MESTALTVWTNNKISALQHTADAIVALQKKVMHTPEGDPLAYVDPTPVQMMLATHPRNDIATEDLVPSDIPEAIVPLTYFEGYALTHSGHPFWDRLEGECVEYFNLFKHYRDLQYQKLNNYNNNTTSNGEQSSLRTITKVAQHTGTDRRVIKTIAKMYHWKQRAEQYDKQRQRELEAQREADRQLMHNTHQQAARKLFDKAVTYFEENAEHLDAKTALNLLNTAVELERLSLGLPKDKPENQDQGYSEHTDRRPWVQINQQYNTPSPSSNATNHTGTANGAGANASDDFSSGTSTREQRISAILRTLHDSGAIDETPTTPTTPTTNNVVDIEPEPREEEEEDEYID